MLVVGAGHAGLAATHGVLARLRGASVVLFEPRTTHLLKPKIVEVLAGEANVEIPLAPLIDSKRIEHVRARVTGIATGAAEVEADGRRYTGDYLVIAAGARTRQPPGIPEKPKRRRMTGAFRPGHFRLDAVEDVLALRDHLQTCVELASEKVSAARRRALLSVLVVGGGYTGVESAAEVAIQMRRLAQEASISPAIVHVTLCEMRERLFAGGVPDEETSIRVDEGLARLAVDVRLGQGVVFEDGVPVIGRKVSDAATVIVATGIEGSLPVPERYHARSRRWSVDGTLRAIGTQTLFAAGDAALVAEEPRAGEAVAASAQHAVQAGAHVGHAIAQDVAGKRLSTFVPTTVGEFVTLGHGETVGWVSVLGRRVHLSGVAASTARAAAFGRYLARLRLGAMLS